MKQTNRQTNEAVIRIYQSLWKNMLLGILCLAFAVGGYSIIKDEECNLVTKVLGGWLNVIFFGAADCSSSSLRYTTGFAALRC